MTWYYPPRQYELGLLHELVRAGFAANRHVDYALNFAPVARTAEFRVNGNDVIPVDGEAGQPPVLFLTEPGSRVDARLAGGLWEPAIARESQGALPPHRDPEPTVEVPLTLRDGLWESERPLLGRPLIRSTTRPLVSSGESRKEAQADPEHAETRHDVIRCGDGLWTTEHRLGFRFLRIESENPVASVSVAASQRPTPRRGFFRCSDDILTEIWQVSADTLHACMQGLMLDGIKRDRMPWIGDQALNTLANAYAFGDADIVAASLTALGRPRIGYINGIADYSLWWIIGTDLFARAFDARDYLSREVDHLHSFIERLAQESDHKGMLRPRPTEHDFHHLVFIDWGVNADETRVPTALQVLWYWALTAGARLLTAAGHDGGERWVALAGTLRETLLHEAWDDREGAWREYVDPESPVSAYPNFLSVLAGLAPVDDGHRIRDLLVKSRRAGTPFMTGFLLRALIEIGETSLAIGTIRDLWGTMLDAGAHSFWEEFADDTNTSLEMYGRPFGKSLCHAWSSGPATLLPDAILGIRPLSDGWVRFTVQPRLGDLSWAHARVPAPQGDIEVLVEAGVLSVTVPPGSSLIYQGEHQGPASLTFPLT